MHNDNDFERAWRVFAAEDARMHAPPALERQLMARLAQPRPASPQASRVWISPAMASAAAVFVLTSAAMMWSGSDRRPPSEPAVLDARAIGTTTFDTLRAAIASEQPIPPRPHATRSRAPLAVTSLVVLAELPPAIMSLGDGPVGATEVLQLVRLRLPRGTLQSLGVVLLEPDAGGVIDIDVLVGEDGLARDIRQVRTGQE